MRLEELRAGATVKGVHPDGPVTVVSVQWFGSEAVELTYKTPAGAVTNELLYRDDETRLSANAETLPWRFDGDGSLFRLVSEAQRIRLAHLYDPLMAVQTSDVDPLPHQITAVYEAMLPRQPLRFLLADDPGAGKTIMAGLLIKELIARGDIERCLIVCPGSLGEQWQGELGQRFQLPFEILTNDKLEAARTGNWFLEQNLVIARLDKLSRDEDVQAKLAAPEAAWDMVVFDEAHKLSATYFGNEVRYTKRYRLAQLLAGMTRHLLLMTATPHNGKQEDFELFLSLLDSDRFEGRQTGAPASDTSDLMRRMVKERLLKFDGKPLFPERKATTVAYALSSEETGLYEAVSDYVREEFNRADKLANGKASSAIGFALTILQRRLASSPEAIYQSLRRRRERMQARLREVEALQRRGKATLSTSFSTSLLEPEDMDDFDDLPDQEYAEAETRVLDQATAAKSIVEFKAEIDILQRLETQAQKVRRAARDSKWQQLANLLNSVFTTAGLAGGVEDRPHGAGPIPSHRPSPRQKLVIFTEHRDTLDYLRERISTLLGREAAVVLIHGGVAREDRLKVQEAFRHDNQVKVLLATDAAGEGINLQRAHLMVNYDLPWNPNRLEQRFGRIHRIGQTEVCHLFNLVAENTREGEVYQRLLEKLEQAREALGGQVFDVLGKLDFQGRPLRDLLVDAIRYGERPDVLAKLDTVVDQTLDRRAMAELLAERQLVPDAMDASGLQRIRENMDRAAARRMQPHYIRSFFLDAFQRLGGTFWQREANRYKVTHVPAALRRGNHSGTATGAPVLPRYERIAFDKSLLNMAGKPLASFVCPGHPLLDAVIETTLGRHRELLKRGAVLVDVGDAGTAPRVLFAIEHALQDGHETARNVRRTISKRVLHVEMHEHGEPRHPKYAPYLDYRALEEGEPPPEAILDRPECAWIDAELERRAIGHAVASAVPNHLAEVRTARLELIEKTKAAVKDRLTKEVSYWDRRAYELEEDQAAGKPAARMNSTEARRRADALEARMDARLAELDREAQISPRPPVVHGGMLVVPIGLLDVMRGQGQPARPAVDTQASAARARAIVMAVERELGFEPTDREFDKLGYDIESRVPDTGALRLIEVKGRRHDADAITVTRNEILYSLNKPEDYILALVVFKPDDTHAVHYLRRPFQKEPDFGVTSVNYKMAELIERAQAPR